MKKTLSILAFFILFSPAIFAVDIPLSIGLGGNLGFDGSVISAGTTYGLVGKQSYSSFSYGLFAFFDARFVEVGLGFSGLANGVAHNETLRMITGIDAEDMPLSGNTLFLSFYGKFPFQINDSLSLYPLIGFEGEIVMSMLYGMDSLYGDRKKGDSYQGNANDWSAFWFRFGIGSDFQFSEGFFLRGELTFGLKANTSRENAIVGAISSNSDFSDISSYGLGGKLTIAVGFTFKTLGLGGGSGGYTAIRSGDNDIYYPR